jgi:hypothetical protein
MNELFPLYHPFEQMEVYFQQIINALTNVPQLTTNKCKKKQKKTWKNENLTKIVKSKIKRKIVKTDNI